MEKKSEVVAAMAEGAGITQAQASAALDAYAAATLGALKAGEIDMVLSGMTITAERNLSTAFVGPYFLSGKSILAKQDSPLVSAQETGQLNQANLRLAALAGSTSQSFVEVGDFVDDGGLPRFL